MKSIYQKLNEARKYISKLDMKKDGFNDYSKYEYFTPEKIIFVVNMACAEVGIMTFFSLERNEYGLHGILKIVDLDNLDETIIFKQATDVPQIKATNITQQYGGAVTYTHRYLLMTAFGIFDNSNEFDSKDHSITNEQLKLIESLIHTTSIDERLQTTIESEMFTYDQERAAKCIDYLKDNQRQSENMSQKEIKEQLKLITNE